jgi:hypothetical protein
LKDFLVMVELCECGVESVQQGVGEDVLTCNVAKVQERRESFGDIDRNKAF